jgi:hypothetical protein
MTNKVVLITGAGRGIGFALAEEMVRRGFKVYGTYRRLPENKPPFEPVAMDVTDHDSVDCAVSSIIEKEGAIHILVNNAGINVCGPLEETLLDSGRRIFETNYFGPLKVIQAVLPSMRQNRNGVIANIGSAAGKISIPFQGHYSASKHAIEGVSESLWHELKSFGIRVLLIEPGDVGTDIWENTDKPPAENSAYSAMLKGFYEVKKKEMDGSRATPPEKVAVEIANIIMSGTKKLRHPVAHNAGVFLFLRKILPDQIFLRAVGGNYGIR